MLDKFTGHLIGLIGQLKFKKGKLRFNNNIIDHLFGLTYALRDEGSSF